MSLDIADRLYDRRMSPPDWEVCPDCKNEWEPHESWCPTHPSEGFLALQEYHAGPEGTPCPVCEWPKPDHDYGCYELGEFEMSYQKTSVDYQEDVWDAQSVRAHA